MSSAPRVYVLGVGISPITMEQAIGEITRWIDQGERRYVCVTGVHGVMECQRDDELRRIHNSSGLTTPDGMPMVWAGHWAGARHMERVYGPDLMLAVCEVAQKRGWSCYFYGGTEGVAELLSRRLVHRFPGLRMVGCYSPPFRPLTPAEEEDVVRGVNRVRPDIVWVGLSTPKQERWMASHVDRLDARVLIGVGAAFDIHAQLVPQAPGWVQRSGFEWLFRLRQEPRRLWRRYLYNNPRFLAAIIRKRPVLDQEAPP
jgi:N-acetylglucosaminyldiphosphoundecaprenol N-acetyl-beta-D-mannosaminyltransferase